MKSPMKPVGDQVIVITGASSGIGLRTAQMAASQGARVVLVARNEEALRNIAEQISGDGGRVTYAVADVADPDAVLQAAKVALDNFGAIDTWMNIAGVGIHGDSQDVPLNEARRLFDTNFWGVVHGTRIAVTMMGHRGGQIINMGSVESERAMPYHAFYSASKHAIKAYTEAVRMEIEKRGFPIAVSLIKPASINTPFMDHVENHLSNGQAPSYMAPVYSVDIAARAILECATHPRRDLTIGGSGRTIELLERTVPSVLDAFLKRWGFAAQERSERPTGHDSNLYSPFGLEGETDGSYDGRVREVSVSTAAVSHPAMSVLLAMGMAAIGALLFNRNRAFEGRAIPAR